MKKNYKSRVVIKQKPLNMDHYELIEFDFGGDMYDARQFTQEADGALERAGLPYVIIYNETVITNED